MSMCIYGGSESWHWEVYCLDDNGVPLTERWVTLVHCFGKECQLTNAVSVTTCNYQQVFQMK